MRLNNFPFKNNLKSRLPILVEVNIAPTNDNFVEKKNRDAKYIINA